MSSKLEYFSFLTFSPSTFGPSPSACPRPSTKHLWSCSHRCRVAPHMGRQEKAGICHWQPLFQSFFSFSNTANSSVNAQKHISEPHSRFLWDVPRLTYLCQQTGHPLASPRSGRRWPLWFRGACFMWKNTPQNYKRNSEGCKTFMVLWRHRSPQLRAALQWEATVLPSSGTGTFQGKHHCPKALELWLCGQTPWTFPLSNVTGYARDQQKWSFPACTSKTTRAPRHKAELPLPRVPQQ